MHQARFLFPRTDDISLRPLEYSFEMVESCHEMRFQYHVAETRRLLIGLYTTQSLVQPATDFTKHDVVARQVRLCIDIPVLIQRSSAVYDPPSPGGKGFLCRQPVGNI